MSRSFNKLTIYSETGKDFGLALRALEAAEKWPDSKTIGFTYGDPVHTSATLKRNKAGVTVWVYGS